MTYFNMSGNSPTNNLEENKERILFLAIHPSSRNKPQHFSLGIRALQNGKIHNIINRFKIEGYTLVYSLVSKNTIAKESELLQNLDNTIFRIWGSRSVRELIIKGGNVK